MIYLNLLYFGVVMGNNKKKAYYSGIGGQAVLEGIMMRNKNKYSIVVRKSDGTMETVVKDVAGNPDKFIEKIPFVRGIFAFAESLKLGTEALEYSAEFYGTDTTEPTGFDKFLTKLFGKHTDAIVSAFTMILALVICLGFFVVLPFVASIFLEKVIINASVISIIEGLIRILLFVSYALLMSFVKDTRRTFMYHGAEHKCINCIEHGKKLTVDNVREASRLHGRCGTNFILIVAIITIIVFVFFFNIESVPLKLLLRVAVIPVIAGISYEVLWIIGRFNNLFTRILAAPGCALQLITTKEPDDEMILVAINAIDAVFDWKSFLLEKFPEDVLPEDLGLEIKEEDKVKISPKKEVKTNGKVRKKKKDVKAVIEPENNEAVRPQKPKKNKKTEQIEKSSEKEEILKENLYENELYEEDLYEGTLENTQVEELSDGFIDEYEEVSDDSVNEEIYEEVSNEPVNEEIYEEVLNEPINEEIYEESEEILDESMNEESFLKEDSFEESNEEQTTDESDAFEEYDEETDTFETNTVNNGKPSEAGLALQKTQPIKLDFSDDYGFDPDDEEVPMDTMSFEPVDESATGEIDLSGYYEESEDYDGPKFNKNIVSIPMPDKISIVEVIPEGGMTSRIYNYDEDDTDMFDDEEEEDYENIFDERGRLNIKDTDAFSKKIDDEFDALFKSLGLDNDDV